MKEAGVQTFLFQQKTALAKKSDCLFAKTSLKSASPRYQGYQNIASSSVVFINLF